MGVYMSKPIKDKESADFDGKLLKCGASSMQGWRVSQEDAHNCCMDFDEETALFAVYDGHGGHEVAEYASAHLPNFIKENEAYKNGDFTTALIDAFLKFDASLKTESVMEELARIAKDGKQKNKDGPGTSSGEGGDSEDDETDVAKLREEASIPIADVIAMYANNLMPPKTPKNKLLCGSSKPMSPFLRAVKPGSSSKDSEVSSSSSAPSSSLTNGVAEEAGGSSSELPTVEEKSKPEPSEPSAQEPTSNGETEDNASGCSSSAPEVTSSSTSNGEVVGSSTSKEDPAVEEASSASSSSPSKSKKEGRKKSGLSAILDSTIPSDDEDSSNDDSFQPNEEVASSSDDDEETVHLNGSKDSEEEEDEEDGENEEVEEESEEEDEDDEELDEEDEDLIVKGGPEEPGMDSGCTAVVALVTKNKLYVANAGDSRAVLCRNGAAVDLSVDHKPEDPIELKRIQNAGGKVTNDGRVNGGLNLSRALGDHFYKRSADLDPKEQMITALPDIVTENIDRSIDEFIVLACDGIWNSMSSQEVVDFVRPLVKKGETLSSICEKLFEACLAPDTCGDGTGCDNMTCVIVKIQPLDTEAPASNKRRSPEPEEGPVETQPESKKPKLAAETES